MNKKNIERIYERTKRKLLLNCEIEGVDFVGININQGNIELKIYSLPEDGGFNIFEEPSIIGYAMDNGLVRCKCHAYSLSNDRLYISLKNRSNDNMICLFQRLENEFPHIKNNSNEIREISLMKVTNRKDMDYASLHMLGIKNNLHGAGIVNLEWLTREMIDTNDPGHNYKYNDTYYLNFTENLGIDQFTVLSEYVHTYFFDLINSQKLHFWLLAIDYYPDGKKKYKLYLKGEKSIDKSCVNVFKKIEPAAQGLINQFKEFLNYHEELHLYGFAICLDTDYKCSFNYYLNM